MMVQPVNGNHLVGGYNVETARSLLDHYDYTPGLGITDCICAAIVNIWKTIQRIFNWIFGDHLWYNNDTAVDILQAYASTPREYPVAHAGENNVHDSIRRLYISLRFRAYNSCCGCAEQSYADHAERSSREIRDFAIANGFLGNHDVENLPSQYNESVPSHQEALDSQEVLDPDEDIIDPVFDARQSDPSSQDAQQTTVSPIIQPSTPASNLSTTTPSQGVWQTAKGSNATGNRQQALSSSGSTASSPLLHRAASDGMERYRQFFRRGETGNIVLLDLTASNNKSRNELIESQAVLEMSLKDYTCRIPEHVEGDTEEERNANYAQAFANLAAIYAPRSYQPRPTDRTNAVVSEPSETLATAKDPYDLFRIALKEAAEELGITSSQLKTNDFISSPLMQKACRLAIFNLLSQASVRTDDCEGPYVVFNENLKARYQKPIIVYAPGEDNEMAPTVLYRADILSSTKTGCDPEGARRLLKDIEDRGTGEEFISHLLDGSSIDDKDMTTLKELIDTMANQMRERYCPTILPMVVKNLNNESEEALLPLSPTLDQNPAFQVYTNSAKTPYEYLRRSVLWNIQQLACRRVFTEDDIAPYEEPNLSLFDHLKNIVFRSTVYGIITCAQQVHDFKIKLSPNIELECGNFYGYEPSADDKGLLAAHLRFIPNELSGDGTESDPSSDPIKAKHLFLQLTQSEERFFRRYLMADAVQRVYEIKGMTEGDTPQARAAKNSLRDIRAALDTLAPERKALIGELFYQITKIVSCIRDSYYTKFAPDIENVVQFPAPSAPIAAPPPPPRPAEEMITQDVKWEYLSCGADEVVIKSRPVRTVGTTHKVNLTNYIFNGRINWSRALSAQNIVINNEAECGNCMYGALALEIFGDNIIDYDDDEGESLEYYAGVLRAAAADYILAHQGDYLPLMLEKTDMPRRNETEDQMVIRLRPELGARLRAYCTKVRNNDTLEWGTAMEMEAIAAIIGTPVHVFYTDHPMKLGKEGIEDGVIQPNSILGGRFTGAPIRLLFNGSHYMPIRLKTRECP